MAETTVAAPAPKRTVGFLLGVGIFLLPYFFAWFTLRRGYSLFARIVAFAWLAFAVLVLAGAVNGAGSSGGLAAVNAAPSTPDAAQAPVAVGTAARIGDLEVTVTGIDQLQSVGPEGLVKLASEGGTLVVVKYATKNVGDHPLGGFRTNGLTLVDPKGTTYNPDSEKTILYSTQADPDQKMFDDINPGITTHGAEVFEVSKTAFDPAKWRAKLGKDDTTFALQ